MSRGDLSEERLDESDSLLGGGSPARRGQHILQTFSSRLSENESQFALSASTENITDRHSPGWNESLW